MVQQFVPALLAVYFEFGLLFNRQCHSIWQTLLNPQLMLTVIQRRVPAVQAVLVEFGPLFNRQCLLRWHKVLNASPYLRL